MPATTGVNRRPRRRHLRPSQRVRPRRQWATDLTDHLRRSPLDGDHARPVDTLRVPQGRRGAGRVGFDLPTLSGQSATRSIDARAGSDLSATSAGSGQVSAACRSPLPSAFVAELFSVSDTTLGSPVLLGGSARGDMLAHPCRPQPGGDDEAQDDGAGRVRAACSRMKVRLRVQGQKPRENVRDDRGRQQPHLIVGFAVVLILFAAVTLAHSSRAGASPSPVPTNQQQAQQQAASAATQVADLQQQVAQAEQGIQLDRQKAEQSQQDFDEQQAVLARATAAEASAQTNLVDGAAQEATANQELVLLVRQLYETGTTTDLSELLAEPDPNQFTTRLADEQQVDDVQTRTLKAYQKAEYARADTELAAQQQLAIQTAAQTKAQNDLLSASTNLAAANAQSAALHAELADAELDEATAQSAIITLADIQGGLSLAQEQALDVKELSSAQELESVPIAPNAGHWTAAEGQSAADRALAWVGLPYAFDGGTATGPSVGVCTSADGGGGEQDCHVVGFDCSGLALYAWAPYESLPHYAASQYLVAGSLHPSLNELLPGDLVFWSTDRTQSGIAHVAIYLGHGGVIQAPESGDVVKITPLISVEPGIFAATRPGT